MAERKNVIMGTITVKKGTSKKEITDEERFVLATNSPVFLKKKKDAEDLIKKVGLPDSVTKRLRK